MRSLVGHGIGRDMHEEPQVPNYGPPGKGIPLEEGMVLAVEPMVNAGRHMVRMGDDGWAIYSQDGSLAAHFEFTIAITAAGPRILTPWHHPEAAAAPTASTQQHGSGRPSIRRRRPAVEAAFSARVALVDVIAVRRWQASGVGGERVRGSQRAGWKAGPRRGVLLAGGIERGSLGTPPQGRRRSSSAGGCA